MALTTGPNMGLLVNGEKGEAHYEALMRFFRGLDTLVQPRVSSMVGALPTTGLTDGLTVVYTGNDANKNRIARYSSVLAGWEYFTPRSGWEIAVVDQIDENGQFKKYQYTGSEWVEKLTAGGLTLAAGDARYERLIKHNLTATTDPTVTNDSTQGYSVLSRWVNTTTKEAFLALDVAPGVANWQKSTLTVDELGTAALAMVGVLDNQLPTVATVKNLLSTLAVFGAGSAASAGTKGLVPAPPQSEVLRFLRSDGVWAFFEIPEGTELSKGANIGEGADTHGLYLQTVGDTLQFKSLRSANNKLKITSSEGNVTLEVMVEGGSDTNITNVGNGAEIFAGMDGSAAKLRTIRAGENMAVEIDGDVLVLTSSGGGGSGGGATDPVPTSVTWTDISDRLSGSSLARIRHFDVSVSSMNLQPMGVVGTETGAYVVFMDEGSESLRLINEMNGLGTRKVLAGKDRMFAIIRDDGVLLTTYKSADYAWMAPDIGSVNASTALHLDSDELWLVGRQDGAIGLLSVFPGGSFTVPQTTTPAGEIYEFACNPWTGTVIGVGYSQAVRSTDLFSSYQTLEFMSISSEHTVAADNKGNWAVHAVGTNIVYCSDNDGLGWEEVALPKFVSFSRMQWSGGVFLLSGVANTAEYTPLFYTSVDAKVWNEIEAPVDTRFYGARIFPENRIMYFAQVWNNTGIVWYEGAVTPGKAGSGGSSGGSSGGVSLENVGGGFPLFQTKVTGPSALRTLLPGPGVFMTRTDTTLQIAVDEQRRVPCTNLFAVDGPDGKVWAPWDVATDLLTPDYEYAWVGAGPEQFYSESGYRYGFSGGAEYRGQKSMPVIGFQFALTRDATMRVWVDALEDGEETGGHFNFAMGSSYAPTQSSQIIAIPAQYDMQWPIEFQLSAYGYEDMLRIEPPEGCQSFSFVIRIEADFEQNGNFVEVAAPIKIEPFEGSKDDPKVLSNWTEIGTNSSNGWISDSGDYSSPLSPRVRLAFGMVELHGCIRYTGGDSGVGRMASVDGPFRMSNAREGAEIDPYGLYPVVVEGPSENSIAFLRVLADGGLVISPIPAVDSVVHLTGVRYPLKWPSSVPF